MQISQLLCQLFRLYSSSPCQKSLRYIYESCFECLRKNSDQYLVPYHHQNPEKSQMVYQNLLCLMESRKSDNSFLAYHNRHRLCVLQLLHFQNQNNGSVDINNVVAKGSLRLFRKHMPQKKSPQNLLIRQDILFVKIFPLVSDL